MLDNIMAQNFLSDVSFGTQHRIIIFGLLYLFGIYSRVDPLSNFRAPSPNQGS